MSKLIILCIILIFLYFYYNSHSTELKIRKNVESGKESLRITKLKIQGNLELIDELNTEREELRKRLAEIVPDNLEAIEHYKVLKEKLAKIIVKIRIKRSKNPEPSLIYEQTRRQIGSNIRNYINFIIHDISSMEKNLNFKLIRDAGFYPLIREYKMWVTQSTKPV